MELKMVARHHLLRRPYIVRTLIIGCGLVAAVFCLNMVMFHRPASTDAPGDVSVRELHQSQDAAPVGAVVYEYRVQTVVDQNGDPVLDANTAEKKEESFAAPQTSDAQSVATSKAVLPPASRENDTPRDTGSNTLSCFRDNSTEYRREFTENEKAMFRYLFDWPEVKTSSCKRMFKMGGVASGEGCLTDGDKYVCLDEPLTLAAAHNNCLIYSFGINYDWSFDEAAEAFGCEVHSFDPSIDYPEGKRSAGITFHHYGIARNQHVNIFGWQMYTLDQIIDMLGHRGRTIHYLKMDAEGGEFSMMAQQLLDGDGEFVLDKVEQIGFEVHFRLDPHLEMGFYRRANRSVHALRQLGYNLVHWEYNKVVKERYMFPGVPRPASLLYEVLLIKNGPDRYDRSERGQREREVVAGLALRTMTVAKSLLSAVVGT